MRILRCGMSSSDCHVFHELFPPCMLLMGFGPFAPLLPIAAHPASLAQTLKTLSAEGFGRAFGFSLWQYALRRGAHGPLGSPYRAPTVADDKGWVPLV